MSIRIGELKSSLSKLNKDEGSIDHIGLIAKNNLNMKVYEKHISQEGADKTNCQIYQLSSIKELSSVLDRVKYTYLSIPPRWIINFNRYTLSKPPRETDYKEDRGSAELDVANFNERNNHFKRAAYAYD